MPDDSLEEVALATAMAGKELSRDEGGESDMVDPLFRALEDEVAHLRQLREAVLDVLLDDRLSREHKLRAIELAFEGEHDTDEDMEEIRDRERLS